MKITQNYAMVSEISRSCMGKAMPEKELIIKFINSPDPSTRCIDALQKVMEFMSGPEGLSTDGKDRRAVYAWFVERYKPGVTILK